MIAIVNGRERARTKSLMRQRSDDDSDLGLGLSGRVSDVAAVNKYVNYKGFFLRRVLRNICLGTCLKDIICLKIRS